MLVMDGSSSILNFDKVKQYMKVRAAETTGQQTPIGNRMGVVVFSGSAEITCPLDWDKARLLACIDKIEQPGGATRTPLGILLAHKHLLDQPNGPHNVDVGLTVGPFDGPYPMPASMQTAERKPVIESMSPACAATPEAPRERRVMATGNQAPAAPDECNTQHDMLTMPR